MTTSEIITLIFSGLVTIATIGYVILTRQLVNETRILRKSQFRPFIIAYLDVAETMADIVYLRIINLGPGVAYNVRFHIIKDIEYNNTLPLNTFGYFNDGINYFPPQHENEFLIFSLQQGDTEAKLNDYIELKIEYDNVFKENKNGEFKLMFKEIM